MQFKNKNNHTIFNTAVAMTVWLYLLFSNLLQYSRQENSMDRGARQVTVNGVAKSQTELSN